MRVNLHKGISISTRTDEKLFDFFRLRSSIKVKEMLVRKLLYADDSDLVSRSIENTQHIVDQFPCAAHMFDLKINTSKTELLYQSPQRCFNRSREPGSMRVHGDSLKDTEDFTYLGSAVTCINYSDRETER
ncbi:uncharacterized protein LOC115212250 [Octopus sinensis]|uniref:Uncharacterized protein LOC115212250 n=1 Tax=Octopus sinensis TaxID=2607531 RepID=A0A6P7SG65_9MOLL|nr:uncharacterized protein LOC115212250 [Octopus sinensis]